VSTHPHTHHYHFKTKQINLSFLPEPAFSSLLLLLLLLLLSKVTVVGGRVPTIVQGHWGYPEPSVYATTRSRFVANAATFCSLVVVLAANVQLVRFKLWMMRRPMGSFVNQNYATLFSVALSVRVSE